MNNEEEFRRSVMIEAANRGMHVSHIEAHISVAGIPDLNLSKNGRDIWLELKVVKANGVKMRPTQKRWHRERHESGGKSWVAVLDRETGDVLVLRGHTAALLAPGVRNWTAAAVIRTHCATFGWMDLLWSTNENWNK